jgi:nucleoside-diphosphate-sugar epimerase
MSQAAGQQARAADDDVILVTGARGFIGAAVCGQLRTGGQHVVAIDRTTDGPDTSIIECDVADIHRIHQVFLSHRPTVVVHCAAYSGPMVARDNPHAIASVNIGGTANLLEAARIHGLRRLVFLSSNTVYGNHPDPISEESALEPTTVYGATKVSGEKLINAYARRYGVEGVSLRISAVYGPNRQTYCYIRTLIENAVRGDPTSLPFGADFPRQYLHIDDAVDAITRAVKTPTIQGRVYNIAGREWLTMAGIADIAQQVLPAIEAHLQPGADPDDDENQGPISVAAAHADHGFAPRVSLHDGIHDYAEWISQAFGLR